MSRGSSSSCSRSDDPRRASGVPGLCPPCNPWNASVNLELPSEPPHSGPPGPQRLRFAAGLRRLFKWRTAKRSRRSPFEAGTHRAWPGLLAKGVQLRGPAFRAATDHVPRAGEFIQQAFDGRSLERGRPSRFRARAGSSARHQSRAWRRLAPDPIDGYFRPRRSRPLLRPGTVTAGLEVPARDGLGGRNERDDAGRMSVWRTLGWARAAYSGPMRRRLAG